MIGALRNSFAGCTDRLLDIVDSSYYHRCSMIHWDLKDTPNSYIQEHIKDVEIILHLAASSHVDRSIICPLSFAQDNVIGTVNLLDWYREYVPKAKMIYFSTDEVFGPAANPTEEEKLKQLLRPSQRYKQENHWQYKEWDRYNSGNPYSASKAAAEEFCLAYANTYGLDICISHCMNVFGSRQHPEKFIPLVIRKILAGEEILVHGDKDGNSGSRFYIHAKNVALATNFILHNGEKGDKYNITGEEEVTNEGLVLAISTILNKGANYKVVDFHSSRPGHDLRYALDGTKLKNMGFNFNSTFMDDLTDVVQWYNKNQDWLKC